MQRLAAGSTLADADQALAWTDPDTATDLLTANREPDAVLALKLEREILVQFVPVTNGADALAAFPNGYFVDDLDPRQNHAIARHLERT